MKRLHVMGFALAAAFCAAQAGAEELTGTLKKIKETGTITIGYRDSSIRFPIWMTTRSRSASRSIFVTRSSRP
ncbi:MAG: hypothetical protein WDN50_02560 [Bradyrhizobium sp.]